jgi:hypothetical protein
MLGDVCGAECMKLTDYISKTVEGELDILIIKPLEAVEKIVKNIDS